MATAKLLINIVAYISGPPLLLASIIFFQLYIWYIFIFQDQFFQNLCVNYCQYVYIFVIFCISTEYFQPICVIHPPLYLVNVNKKKINQLGPHQLKKL